MMKENRKSTAHLEDRIAPSFLKMPPPLTQLEVEICKKRGWKNLAT
jgi:hypothetical protein